MAPHSPTRYHSAGNDQVDFKFLSALQDGSGGERARLIGTSELATHSFRSTPLRRLIERSGGAREGDAANATEVTQQHHSGAAAALIAAMQTWETAAAASETAARESTVARLAVETKLRTNADDRRQRQLADRATASTRAATEAATEAEAARIAATNLVAQKEQQRVEANATQAARVEGKRVAEAARTARESASRPMRVKHASMTQRPTAIVTPTMRAPPAPSTCPVPEASTALSIELSPNIRAQLEKELPPESSAEVTRRIYDARRRRESQRIVPCTVKREANSMHGADYVIEHRTLHAANIPPAPGTIDLRDYPQQSPQAVIEIMIQLAVANKIEPDLLGHVLLGALRISPRTPGGAAELGSYPVPAGIEPVYAAALLERAGIGGITEESLRCGVDAGYYGGKRLHAISNHSSVMTGPAVEAIKIILAEHRSKGETLDVTPLLVATPQIPHIFCALGAVEKSGDRWRLIHDGTSGDAINTQSIPAPELRPARITSAAEFERKLVELRERVGPDADIHIFYRDVKGAYTRLAQRPQDQLLSAWNFDGRLEISLRSLFGTRTPGFVCCAVTTAIAHATQEDCSAVGIDSFVVSFVDDIAGACVSAHTEYAESVLDGHMVASGMPPATDKLRQARAVNALYLGLLWDTRLMRVSLPPDKRDKARAAAALVAGARRMRARDLQAALGVLDYTSTVQPVLSAFLGGARRCLLGRRPDAWVIISDEARADAALWLPIINAHDGHRLIPQSVREKDAPSVVVDASTTTGLGFFSPEAKIYFSMPLREAELGDTAHIINKLEQLAAYLGFLAVAYDGAAALKNTRAINIFTDNQTAKGATNKLRSTSKEMSYFTRCLAVHSASLDILPRSTFLCGTDNSQADALSRGTIPATFLEAGWRHLTIPATTLTALLTSEEPWNVDVTFSCVDATHPSATPTTLSAPCRPVESTPLVTAATTAPALAEHAGAPNRQTKEHEQLVARDAAGTLMPPPPPAPTQRAASAAAAAHADQRPTRQAPTSSSSSCRQRAARAKPTARWRGGRPSGY